MNTFEFFENRYSSKIAITTIWLAYTPQTNPGLLGINTQYYSYGVDQNIRIFTIIIVYLSSSQRFWLKHPWFIHTTPSRPSATLAS